MSVATSGVNMRQPTARQPRRADIQGLRAVAVLLVVAVHAGLPVPAGFAGVDFFFVVSGYVITHQIQYQQQAPRGFSFPGFYAARIRRLMPALVLMVTTVTILSFLFQSPLGAQQSTGSTAVGTAALLANMAILRTSGSYFDAAATTNPLLHVWSLAVEEQFYLAFPLVLVACTVLGRRRAAGRRTAVVLTAATAASFILAMFLTYRLDDLAGFSAGQVSFYSSPTRAWEFGAGALLALWATTRHVDLTDRRRAVNWSSVAGGVGVGLLIAMNFVIDGASPWPGALTLIPVTATALIIAAGTAGNGWATRGLATGPLVKIGDWSYSVYLWHWPAILFAGLLWPGSWVAVIAAVASIVPAWISYTYVEEPIRNRFARRGQRRRVFRVAAAASACVVVLGAALHSFGPAAVGEAGKYEVQRKALTFGRSTGCLLDNRAFTPGDLDRCTVSVPRAKGSIMLVGDSHADALSTGLIAAAKRLGYGTTALTGAGCEFSRTAPPSPSVPNCAAMNGALLDRATGPDAPAAVVMSHWVATRTDLDPNWIDALRPALDELSQAGVPVIFALDVPGFGGGLAYQSTSCRGGFVNFTCDRRARDIYQYQGASRQRETALVADFPGVHTFDPWPTFCRAGSCSSIIDGKLAYWDDNHLNATGSMALAGGIGEALRASLPPS